MAARTLQIQAYYDYNTIYVPGSLGNSLRTFDLDVQHNFSWGDDQDFVWGGDYRYMEDKFDNIASIQFLPPMTTQHLASAFVQDTIALADTVNLIAGAKVEDDPFIGVQFLPSMRASWKPDSGDLLWASVSRAVRAPSLWDRDLNELLGSTLFLTGGHFGEEKLIAYEAGYRAQPMADISFSLSLYYNVYDDLRSVEPSPGPSLPLLYGNMMEGTTHGVEFWGNYAVAGWWRLSAGFNWEHKDLRFKRGSYSPLLGQGTFIAGDDPAYQASLRSSMDLPHDLKLDVTLRDVARLPNPAVPSYFEMDARLAWNVMDNLELAVSGANLLHDHHAEFLTTGGSNEVPRSVLASIRWAL